MSNKPKPKKPKLRKGDTMWWTIACEDILLSHFARPTKKEAIEAFNSSEFKMLNLNYMPLHKPVKIIVRLANAQPITNQVKYKRKP